MTTDRHARFFVSGKVQGVFFRAATREQAQALGLAGYVRNLDDGRVEVYAHGARECIEVLERWLWRGASNAEVSAVQAAPAESACDEHSGSENFHIR